MPTSENRRSTEADVAGASSRAHSFVINVKNVPGLNVINVMLRKSVVNNITLFNTLTVLFP